MSKELGHINIGAKIIEVPHKGLKRFDDGIFKSICPACNDGPLLVYRHPKTYILQEYDLCHLCGQRIKYTDIEDLRKKDPFI